MAASKSAEHRKARWTLVDKEGSIQGSDSDDATSTSSSDCVAVEADAVHYHSKKMNSRSSAGGLKTDSLSTTGLKDSLSDRELVNKSSASDSWLGSLWSNTQMQLQNVDSRLDVINEGKPLPAVSPQEKDDVDTDSMESIEVLSMPSDHDYNDDGRNGILNFDPVGMMGSQRAQSENVVEALCSMNVVTPVTGLSPSPPRVEDVVSSSNSSQLDFLLLEHPENTDSSEATPTIAMATANEVVDVDLDDMCGFEHSLGTAGPLPVMPQSELPMSSVSVDNIPRGVAAGGSPRRVQSTGNIPKRVGPSEDTDPNLENVPIMTQRWPTEDGGFLLVQQFRGDGEPAMSCSSSFSDLSSSLLYPGLSRRIPDNNAPNLQRQSSDASSEATHYSDASDDALPANMTVSIMKPGVRQYLHKRDEGFNSKLTMAAFLVLTAGVALVVGHYIGSTQATSHHLDIEAGQVWRLRSLQDQLVTCLGKTKNLLKGKGTRGSSPAKVSHPSGPTPSPELMKKADVQAQQPHLEDHHVTEKQKSRDDNGHFSCSSCINPNRPNARYTEFCNTKCTPRGTSVVGTDTEEIGGENEIMTDLQEKDLIVKSEDNRDNVDVHPLQQGRCVGMGEDGDHGQLLQEEEAALVDRVSTDFRSVSESVPKCRAATPDRSELGGVWADIEGDANVDLELSHRGIMVLTDRQRGVEKLSAVRKSEEGGFGADIDGEPEIAHMTLLRDTVVSSDKQSGEKDLSNTKSDEGEVWFKASNAAAHHIYIPDTEISDFSATYSSRGEVQENMPSVESSNVDFGNEEENRVVVDDLVNEKLKYGKSKYAAIENPLHSQRDSDNERDEGSTDVVGSNDLPQNTVEPELEDREIDQEAPENSDGTFIERLSSNLGKTAIHSWSILRNYTSDVVKSASHISYDNVRTQLKENVQNLRHQIKEASDLVKDAASSLQKSNITAQIKGNVQNLGERVQDAVSGIQKSNITSQIKESVQSLGEQVQDAISSLQESNITTQIKGGVQSVRKHVKESFKSLQNVLKGSHSSGSTDGEKEDESLDFEKRNEYSYANGKPSKKYNKQSKGKSGIKEKNVNSARKEPAQKMQNIEAKKDTFEWKSGDVQKNKEDVITRDGKDRKESKKGNDTSKGMTKKDGSTASDKTKVKNSRNHNRKNDKVRRNKKHNSDWKNRKDERNQRKGKGRKGKGRQDNKRHNKPQKTREKSKESHDKYSRNKHENREHHHNRKQNHRQGPQNHHKQHKHRNQNHNRHEHRNEEMKQGSKHRINTDDWTFKNIDWEDVFDRFDVRCHGVHNCLRNQREAALKLYEELLHYQDWLSERCYKKHLDELTDFMEELEEFLTEPTMTDAHLEELKEDFEDMAEDIEKATKKYFKNMMKKENGSGHSKNHHSSAGHIHHRSNRHQSQHSKNYQSDEEKPLTVTLDLKQVLNTSGTLNDAGQDDDRSEAGKRKHAGYGYQSNDDWFVRRMHDRENQRQQQRHRESTANDRNPGNADGDWYQHWMQGRMEARVGVTVWDMYEWFSKRQALRNEWRIHEMDDQSNWFLRRP